MVKKKRLNLLGTLRISVVKPQFGFIDADIAPELQLAIDRDIKAGRLFTMKDIQTLNRCSFDKAHEIVANEPGVIMLIPHVVFRNICIELKKSKVKLKGNLKKSATASS